MEQFTYSNAKKKSIYKFVYIKYNLSMILRNGVEVNVPDRFH